MNRQLVIQLGLSVCAAGAAAGACVYAGGGVLLAFALYCLCGSVTLVTLAAVCAYLPLRLHTSAAERVYA